MWRRRHARVLFAVFAALATFASCASDESEDNFFDFGGGIRDASVRTEAAPGPGAAGTSQAETCVEEFCPLIGAGAPCCISTRGPCGMDNGSGCRQTTGSDR